jgi:hypothetical protein
MASPNHFKSELLNGTVDWANDTIKVALGSDNTAYTFDQAAHEFVGDVFDGGTTGTEFAGTGYSRQTLANAAVTQDDTDNEGVADADDVTFSSIDGDTIQFIVVYKQVGTDDATPADDPILALYDDDSAGSLADLPLTTNSGDVTVSWDAEGIINIQ